MSFGRMLFSMYCMGCFDTENLSAWIVKTRLPAGESFFIINRIKE